MYIQISELNINMDLPIEKDKYYNKKYLTDLFDSIINIIGEKTFNKYKYCIVDALIDDKEIIRTFNRLELLNWFHHKKNDRYKVVKVIRA